MNTKGSEDANIAGIMIHGRGASPSSILRLSKQIKRDDVFYMAPKAEDREWYPNRFIAPIEENQPHLDNALAKIENTFDALKDKGFQKEDIFLLGFSQGACLATEYAARNPQRYRAVIGLSGGLIGPVGKNFDYEGDMESTEVFLGCSDKDPHIPVERVDETAEKFVELNAEVDKRLYEGRSHSINQDEIQKINELLK